MTPYHRLNSPQGMNPAKAGGVEMYTPADYLESRGHWGDGGVILHELCHAFHDRCSRQRVYN